MNLVVTHEIVRRVEGPLEEVITAEAAPIPAIADVLASMREMAFMVETVAHLQGKEREWLPTAERARALIARLGG